MLFTVVISAPHLPQQILRQASLLLFLLQNLFWHSLEGVSTTDLRSLLLIGESILAAAFRFPNGVFSAVPENRNSESEWPLKFGTSEPELRYLKPESVPILLLKFGILISEWNENFNFCFIHRNLISP